MANTESVRREVHVLNLGAGVQSTTLFLMSREGLVHPFDAAIFADTQEEPQQVYRHIEWLKSLGSPRIITTTKGKLGDHLKKGTSSTGQRFASIPAFTAPDHRLRPNLNGCEHGRIQRQCTKEYKIEPIGQAIRRILLGLAPRRRVPASIHIHQYYGISYDERKRATKIKQRNEGLKQTTLHFPLIEKNFTRDDCKDWLSTRVPHEVPRSACTFCPFKTYTEWLKLKTTSPADWQRAIDIDKALRVDGNIVNRSMDLKLYLVRKCIPLDMVDLEAEAKAEQAKKPPPDMFALLDCGLGMCGV